MSSQAPWSEGGRNAPDETKSRKCPPSCVWMLPKSAGRNRIGSRRAIERRRSNAVVRPRFSTSRSMALQNRSRTCGTTTIEVTWWSRSESKMTRGFRLRT